MLPDRLSKDQKDSATFLDKDVRVFHHIHDDTIVIPIDFSYIVGQFIMPIISFTYEEYEKIGMLTRFKTVRLL